MPFRAVAIAAATLFAASVTAVAVRGADDPGSTHPQPPTTASPDTSAPTDLSEPSPAVPATPSGGDAADAKVVVSPRGVVLPVKARQDGAYRVVTPCAKSAVVRSGTPVSASEVVLDPGHGGDEAGAIGPNGLAEKTVNLAVAGYTKAALEGAGVTTVLTRTGDYRMTLGTRADVALALRPKAFVSIHHNSEPDGPRPGPGTETFHQLGSAGSRRLAGLIYEEVVRALSAYRVAWVADRDAGAKYRRSSSGDDYYGILRRAGPVTAVLAELAFVSNRPEAELVSRPDVQQVEGQAVARGILRYLRTADPGSGYVEPYPRTSPAGPGGTRQGCVDPPL